MTCAGLHLLPHLDLVESPRRSALAELDPTGRLVGLELLAGDDEVVRALPPGPALIAVDQPLAVPAGEGQRDVERVLAWCDAPAFPVSQARMGRVYGGMRAADLAPRLSGPGRHVVEALPALVLRELAWERGRPPGADERLDLAEYRTRWLPVRPPVYRGRGAGRAHAAGLAAAHALLAGVMDLGGWAPAREPDDWEALHDAARLDALACAYAAWRHHRDGGRTTVLLGTPDRGQVIIPADGNLRGRIAVNLARLRVEGAVRI